MELQHVNVKLLVGDPARVDLEAVVPVFHGWIQDQAGQELLLDVADYRHVYAGPGVVLIGHEANYSLDNADLRLGVRYNRKAVLEGTIENRLTQATRAALHACQRLEGDARLGGMVRFNGQDIEVFVNDRLMAPNSEATRQAVEPAFQAFFQRLFGGDEFALSYRQDPRRVFSVSVRASQQFDTASLLNNLDSVGVDTQPEVTEPGS